eukprot:m.194510 g.194510  ORF g.194510 m.194510 type:complete len:410 (+) comp32532_c0_seq1:264-1493(+)
MSYAHTYLPNANDDGAALTSQATSRKRVNAKHPGPNDIKPLWMALGLFCAFLMMTFFAQNRGCHEQRSGSRERLTGAMNQVGRLANFSKPTFEKQADQAPSTNDQDSRHADVKASSNDGFVAKYGFYMHVFDRPPSVIHQVKQIQKFFPDSPIYMMSDGGYGFDGVCLKFGCTFKHCPPANDRWHPWPFLHRMREAAIEMNTEYVIYLEPDNTIHGPITHEPEYDAGGMQDNNYHFPQPLVDYVEKKAQSEKPDFKWGYQGSGLAGGSYFKTSVIKEAFSDEKVAQFDWAIALKLDGNRVLSSDFAMPILLSASGFQYRPWKDLIQKDLPNQPVVDTFAFEHYGRGVDGGKPEYNLVLHSWRDEILFSPKPAIFQKKQVVCHICWNISAYVENWGTTDCANPHPTPNYA